MTEKLLAPDLVVAVFGAGTMGRGIAQVCAQAGIRTLLSDTREGVVKEAIAAIDKALEGQVAKGRMTAEAKASTLANLVEIKMAPLRGVSRTPWVRQASCLHDAQGSSARTSDSGIQYEKVLAG